VNLLKPRPRIDPMVSKRICGWARELWAVPDDGTVFVAELRCAEPYCPPVETVVKLLSFPERFGINRSRAGSGR
jgi:hypothetical protein